jgi:hypothetical protein
MSRGVTVSHVRICNNAGIATSAWLVFSRVAWGLQARTAPSAATRAAGIALIAVIHNNVIGIAQLRRSLRVLLELPHDVRRID